GGARLVEVGLPERLLDDLALELVDRRAERLAALEDLLLDVPRLLIRAAHLLGEVADVDHRALGKDEEPLDEVLELADVPRPAIAQEGFHGLGRERLLRHPHLARLRLREVADEEREVVASLAERREVHADDVQSIEEI